MSVVVDTSVWSEALRRRRPSEGAIAGELSALVRDHRVVMLGSIRQELLSGVNEPGQFVELRDRLRAFPDLRLVTADYEEAAECFNRCRARGVQGSNTDFLICAAALRRGLPVFTTDRDFDAFARILEIRLHDPR